MFDESTYTEEQGLIVHVVSQLAKDFDHAYFLGKCRDDAFPGEFWKVLSEGGYMGCVASEEYGGSDFSTADLVAFMTALGRGGMASNVLVNQLACCDALMRLGSDDQKEEHIPAIVSGTRWTYANIEKTQGRGLFELSLAATPDGDNFLLNGSRSYVVGADGAAFLLVPARTADRDASDPGVGLSLFVVPTDAEGLCTTRKEVNVRVTTKREPVAATGDSFFEVVFDGVSVPAANRIGVEGQGGDAIESIASRIMLMMSGMCIGWGDRILEQTVEYANNRVIYEEPIGSYQAVQHPLVRARTEVEMAKLLTERAAQACDDGAEGEELMTYASVAKYSATEAAYAACDIGVQAHGGSGFDRDTGIITLWPLILMSRILPLNNDVILERFAEVGMGLPVSLLAGLGLQPLHNDPVAQRGDPDSLPRHRTAANPGTQTTIIVKESCTVGYHMSKSDH